MRGEVWQPGMLSSLPLPTTHSRTPRHVNKRDVNNIVEETVRASGERLPRDYFFWSLVRSGGLEGEEEAGDEGRNGREGRGRRKCVGKGSSESLEYYVI